MGVKGSAEDVAGTNEEEAATVPAGGEEHTRGGKARAGESEVRGDARFRAVEGKLNAFVYGEMGTGTAIEESLATGAVTETHVVFVSEILTANAARRGGRAARLLKEISEMCGLPAPPWSGGRHRCQGLGPLGRFGRRLDQPQQPLPHVDGGAARWQSVGGLWWLGSLLWLTKTLCSVRTACHHTARAQPCVRCLPLLRLRTHARLQPHLSQHCRCRSRDAPAGHDVARRRRAHGPARPALVPAARIRGATARARAADLPSVGRRSPWACSARCGRFCSAWWRA